MGITLPRPGAPGSRSGRRGTRRRRSGLAQTALPGCTELARVGTRQQGSEHGSQIAHPLMPRLWGALEQSPWGRVALQAVAQLSGVHRRGLPHRDPRLHHVLPRDLGASICTDVHARLRHRLRAQQRRRAYPTAGGRIAGRQSSRRRNCCRRSRPCEQRGR
ncbi:hypothetical protein AB1Y20_007110 [Prymnesium parvum]|uniref:Uncharacterized protein n=1 Tax=Prymnesium parvum TaxID=97485 RepID=A0AB34J084_PRYPA